MLLILVGAIITRSVLNRVFAAADSFQLTLDTSRAVEAFITTTDPPAWPTSWSDLFTHPPSAAHFTEDPARYKNLVLLDFTPTLAEIAVTDNQTQQFLVPADPGYLENWRDYLQDLPAIAVEALEPQQDP